MTEMSEPRCVRRARSARNLLQPQAGIALARGVHEATPPVLLVLALPTLFATVAGDVDNGDVIGPDGIGEAWGHPKKVTPGSNACDDAAAERLWEVSQELTGVRYLD